MLSVANLTMRFGGLKAVDDLSFEARAGDITAVIGPNGAGKTTVFNCITGFYRPPAGPIVLTHPDGTDLSAAEHARPPDRRRRPRWPGRSRTSACSPA